jgi:hypothetical protein
MHLFLLVSFDSISHYKVSVFLFRISFFFQIATNVVVYGLLRVLSN